MIALTLELTTGALTGDTLLVDTDPMRSTEISITPKLDGAAVNPVDISRVNAMFFNGSSPAFSLLFSRDGAAWKAEILGKEIDPIKTLPLNMQVFWSGTLHGKSALMLVAFPGPAFQTPGGKRGRLQIEDDLTITPLDQ